MQIYAYALNISVVILKNNDNSGTLKDQNNTPLSNIELVLRDAFGNRVAANTSSTGAFTIPVQPGIYSLGIAASGHPQLGGFGYSQPINNPTINLSAGSVVQDLTLPVATIEYSAYDHTGTPLSPSSSRIRAEASLSSLSSPITLYPGAPVANHDGYIRTNILQPNTQGSGTFKTIVGAKFSGGSKNDGVCSFNYPQMMLRACNAVPITVIDGQNSTIIRTKSSGPNGLIAQSPTDYPNLSWQSASSATKYYIYRNGAKIGESTSTSFADNNVPDGTYNYQVSFIDSFGIESYPSTNTSVTVEQTVPTIGSYSFSKNPVFKGQISKASVSLSRNLYGIIGGEYYIGESDPGTGNGTSMIYTNGLLVADFNGLDAGQYNISFRALNSIGWSEEVTGSLTVVKPSFSGLLRDQNGNPIRNISITLRDEQNNSFSTNTDVSGNFSLAVEPALYSLKVENNSWNTSPSRLVRFKLEQPISSPTIDLTSNNVIQNLVLPLSTVDFTVYNAQGYPTGNVMVSSHAIPANTVPISLYPGGPSAVHTANTYSNSIGPDSSGKGWFKSIVGTTFIPDSMQLSWKSGGVPTYNQTSLTVIDGVNSIDLPNTPVTRNTFSGILNDQLGNPLQAVRILTEDAYGNYESSTTSSTGEFNIQVQPGIYSLDISTFNHPVLGTFNYTQPKNNPTLNLQSGNLTQNLTLPLATVNYSVYDNLGLPITSSNARIRARASVSSGSSNISLYSGGPDAFQYAYTYIESQEFNSQGSGNFTTIAGANFIGSSITDGICTYRSPHFVALTCNDTPFLLASGTNMITLTEP